MDITFVSIHYNKTRPHSISMERLNRELLEVVQHHGHDQHNTFYCSEVFLHFTKRTTGTCSERRNFGKIYSS
jgi:phenylalanyl-tRNA synthetase alpha subunit